MPETAMVGANLDPEYLRKTRFIAGATGRTKQSLVAEALDLLFKAHAEELKHLPPGDRYAKTRRTRTTQEDDA
ncbi:hypothetical protein GHK68_00060 [Sinorhizobium meliloti]|uniref:ribbon-helix-helix domain-containing protein n=1 Tax=Rhizobium meliloti TaxID=382 RepID=UPI001297D537|nr:ribbon-helix-helix domain-containing protein [Sinorhizobium meliloti]MQW40781.1 hypothetical protein [Sinorhizobium meliloti]